MLNSGIALFPLEPPSGCCLILTNGNFKWFKAHIYFGAWKNAGRMEMLKVLSLDHGPTSACYPMKPTVHTNLSCLLHKMHTIARPPIDHTSTRSPIPMSIAPSRTMACDFHKVRPEIALGLEQSPQIVGDRTGQLSFLLLGVEQ